MLDAIRSEQYKTRHTKIFTILCVGALVLGVIALFVPYPIGETGEVYLLSM